jgi:tetratricopeptide (TPR) repeat protein
VQNPESPIDLVVTIDSLFRVVETAKPACSEITTAYRGGLPGYLGLVNGAINALNAEKLDSAEHLAAAANRLYPGSPYGVMVLGNVASKRKDDAKALEYWSAAATVAAKDTIYRDVERQVLNNQGMLYMSTANTASGAQRAEAARHAIQVYNTLLAVPGTTGVYSATGRQNLQTAQLLLGDTASFVAGYQPMIANPSAYTYQDLLNTAMNAVRANRTADAAKLFEGALVVNPWNRDALYNLGVEYIALNQNDKVQPLVQRLIALDPANPVNYFMAAQAFQARSKEAQAAKRTPLVAAFNDSTLQWIARGEKLPTEVTFTTFYSTDKVTTLAGTITDRRDKAAAPMAAAPAARGAKAKPAAKPALPAQAVTVTIETLDKSGAVVGSKVITTAPLVPGGSETFNTTIPGDAIAYRYRVGA